MPHVLHAAIHVVESQLLVKIPDDLFFPRADLRCRVVKPLMKLRRGEGHTSTLIQHAHELYSSPETSALMLQERGKLMNRPLRQRTCRYSGQHHEDLRKEITEGIDLRLELRNNILLIHFILH